MIETRTRAIYIELSFQKKTIIWGDAKEYLKPIQTLRCIFSFYPRIHKQNPRHVQQKFMKIWEKFVDAIIYQWCCFCLLPPTTIRYTIYIFQRIKQIETQYKKTIITCQRFRLQIRERKFVRLSRISVNKICCNTDTHMHRKRNNIQ